MVILFRMFSFLPLLTFSWGPIFHQTIAEHFASEYFSNLTTEHRAAFVLGSVWADGLDKTTTHRMNLVIEKLRQINDVNCDVYWFFVGIFCHIPPDTFAHAGKSGSFIVPHGILHSFSELVVDSFMMHKENPKVLPMPSEILREIEKLNVPYSKTFYVIYRSIYLLSKTPLFRFLRFIERDDLPHSSYREATDNFRKHYVAMLRSMREAIARIWENGFNEVRMREISTRLVYDI
jgi:hypothetical protein